MKRFENIYLVGSGRVAGECLKELHGRKVDVTYIEDTSERFSFTRKLCERCGIGVFRMDKRELKEFLLAADKETLIFSVHNSYLFPSEVVEKENLTILNLHIAYLPKYRGMNAATWAIFYGEPDTGATWHEVGSGIDNGRIIVQRKVPVLEDETAMQLMVRCFQAGIELFRENLDAFLEKSYRAFLPAEGDTKLYLAKELPNDGILDLDWGFDKAYAFLRSMDYSGTNLMPLPKIGYEGKLYEIAKYKKEKAGFDGDIGEKIDGPAKGEMYEDILKLKWGGVYLGLLAA